MDGFAKLSMPLPAGDKTWNHPGIRAVDGNIFSRTIGSTVYVKSGRRVIGYDCPGWITTDSGPTLTYVFESGLDHMLDCKGTPSIRVATTPYRDEGVRTGPLWNAAELQRRLSIGRPWKELTPYEERARFEGLTYVWGVADSIEGESACIMGAINEGPLNDVVLAYMADNSTDPQTSAGRVVKLALSKAFPCPTHDR
jgi:hypothetical protein